MHELREHLKNTIQNDLVPFLKKYDFEFALEANKYSDTHDIFIFKKQNNVYLNIDHMGFHVHDYPWSIIPMLGKAGFKGSSTQFDSIPLWYWKQKIAPFESWQRDALKLTFDNYPVNSKDQITQAIKQVVFDLENFCKDFLTNDFNRFDKIRQIKYLEYLVQTQVLGEYHWTGKKKFTFYQNKEVE